MVEIVGDEHELSLYEMFTLKSSFKEKGLMKSVRFPLISFIVVRLGYNVILTLQSVLIQDDVVSPYPYKKISHIIITYK